MAKPTSHSLRRSVTTRSSRNLRSAKPSTRSQDVFTPAAVVRHMSDLCEPLLSDPARKVFEPGCGTSNFLIEALSRRLAKSPSPTDALLAVSNLYGVDINSDYLATARNRLKSVLVEHFLDHPLDYRFWPLVDLFLNSNIAHGDLLKDPAQITFVDWQPVSAFDFRAVPTSLATLLDSMNISEHQDV